jgi:hypothetical protein
VVDKAEGAGVGVEVTRHRTLDIAVGTSLLAALTEQTAPLPVELIEWRIGDVEVISLPGEAFCAFGEQVVASRDNPVLMAGLAPIWQGYLPVPFREGYEEGLSYGEAFVLGVLDAIVGR